MRLSLRLWAPILFCALAGPVAAPAHADPWIQIGSGEVPAPDPSLVTSLVDGVLRAAKGTACKPATADVTAYNLGWETWANPATGAIAYLWTGPGSARVSTDCGTDVHVTVQVSDYAPAGRPPVVRGNLAPGSSSSASGGVITAAAESKAWVVYYDLANLAYMRGNSLVEIKVNGTYYNAAARATLPIGCVASYTPVTPTPAGPQFGETYTAACQ